MAVYNLSVIHLGNLADLDPVDCNESAENQPALLDTYYGAADPAAGHITTLTVYDDNDDQRITSNDRSDTEAIVFDLGSGPQTTVYDALFNVRATVSFGPGSGQPDDTGLAGNVQTATGDVFLVMVDDGEGWGSNPYDDFPIESRSTASLPLACSRWQRQATRSHLCPALALARWSKRRAAHAPLKPCAWTTWFRPLITGSSRSVGSASVWCLLHV